jgi:hypothetical protein
MKKIALLATVATALFASNVSASVCNCNTSADNLSLKLNGRFSFEGGAAKQSKLSSNEKYITANRKNLAINSNAYVGVRAEAENESMKYGAQLGLYTASRNSGSPSYERSHLFTESDYGKLELGSNWDVGTKMTITALSVARASGDNAESYSMLDIKNAKGETLDSQALFPSFFLGKLDGNNRESTRKITYYTPKFGPLQFGISYIPDSSNFGSFALKDDVQSKDATKTYELSSGKKYVESKTVKDAISAGVTLEHHMTDTTSVKLALTSEYGKAAKNGVLTDAGVKKEYKIAKLNSYNVGAVLTTGNFSFVGSYTDAGKSLTSSEVYGTDRRTRYYSAGAVYAQGPVGFSVSYYKADKNKNKSNSFVVGTDYTLAPGFQPYAEVAFFNGKGKAPAVYNDNTSTKFKGTVFLFGMSMSF